MSAPPKDRLRALQEQLAVNGLDFVEVDEADHRILRVHFQNTTPVPHAGVAATITGGDSIPTIPVGPINNADWSLDAEGRPLLTLRAASEGDFSNYLLSIEGADAVLDRMFRTARFSFKAFCPSDFDCADPDRYCPPDDTPLPPIDYLAKDFQSFRQALLEFSSLRYPAWQERSEADFAVMFAEALSALGDELSYQQDRAAAETAIETATQRRSLIALARLVDYEPRPATSARAILQCDVTGTTVPAGARVAACTADGDVVGFEVGTGLGDATLYATSPKWNSGKLTPYWWDDKDRCLPRGATWMWLEGHNLDLAPGVELLIQTDLPGESIRQVVTLTEPPVEDHDELFPQGTGTDVTLITWGSGDGLLRERDQTLTAVAGNLLKVTQGVRHEQVAAIDVRPFFAPRAPLAIAREGPNGDETSPNFVHRVPIDNAPIAWLAKPDDPKADPVPEIRVTRTSPSVQPFDFARSLLNADGLEPAFTIDPIAWRPVAWADDDQVTQWEMDGDGGESLRFGDGVFGEAPAEGDFIEISYRTGAGALGNVPADSIVQVDPAFAAVIAACRNPFPAWGGADAESAERVRRLAPQAFRAKQFRAVRPPDYAAAAEELDWVQQAGSCFRYTGSWFTVFTAPDAKGGETFSRAEHLQLVQLLNRRRLAGYESYSPPPRYVSVDLEITICVKAESLAGTVEKAVLDRLGSAQRPDGAAGFFFADHFTFGAPLLRSRLEAAIQGAPGVAGVLAIRYRRRGTLVGFIDLPEVVELGTDEILRVDNDPDWPERGVIKVITEGGR